MDEECLRPGEPTDKSFLAKMNENLSRHKHYISHEKAGKDLQKSMAREVRSKIYVHFFLEGGGDSLASEFYMPTFQKSSYSHDQ